MRPKFVMPENICIFGTLRLMVLRNCCAGSWQYFNLHFCLILFTWDFWGLYCMMEIILPILQIKRLHYIQTGPVEFPRHAGPGLRFPASRLTSPPLNERECLGVSGWRVISGSGKASLKRELFRWSAPDSGKGGSAFRNVPLHPTDSEVESACQNWTPRTGLFAFGSQRGVDLQCLNSVARSSRWQMSPKCGHSK